MVTLLEVIENIRWGLVTRIPISESDFGDDGTVGLKLKASGKSFNELEDYDFAIYFGSYKGKWHVGVCRIPEFKPSNKNACEKE